MSFSKIRFLTSFAYERPLKSWLEGVKDIGRRATHIACVGAFMFNQTGGFSVSLFTRIISAFVAPLGGWNEAPVDKNGRRRRCSWGLV
jgi:hypothetical protein